MSNKKRMNLIIINFIMLTCFFVLNITAVYAWYEGQTYSGKTMSYHRSIFIGSTSSNVTNYYGYLDETETFIYNEINPEYGFEYNNLIPSSYMYLRTDIQNMSSSKNLTISLFLQNIVYDEPLNSFLYFGTNDPIITRAEYQSAAVYDSATERYTINSVPLLSSYLILPNESISLYWYVYIDSNAGIEIANAYINLGDVVLTYNS